MPLCTPLSSGSSRLCEEHINCKDDLSRYGREEYDGDYAVRAKDTVHGTAASGHNSVPMPDVIPAGA